MLAPRSQLLDPLWARILRNQAWPGLISEANCRVNRGFRCKAEAKRTQMGARKGIKAEEKARRGPLSWRRAMMAAGGKAPRAYVRCRWARRRQGSVRDSDGPREPRRPISFPLFIYHHHRRFIIGDFIVAVSLSLSSSPARQRGRERPAATAAFAFSLLRDFLLFRRAGGVTGRLPRLSSGWVPFVYLPSSLSLC